VQIIEVGDDEVEGKPYLKCEFNMYGDSFRSPWSNQFFPAIEAEDGDANDIVYPSHDLLQMEVSANAVFQRYAKLYYDNNFLTSVYFFDTDDNGFGSCWLVKKSKYLLYSYKL